MCIQTVIKVLAIFGPIVVAIVAIYYADRNNRRQILVGKLEELFEVIELLSRYYYQLYPLYLSILDYRDPGITEIQNLDQYYAIRDKSLSENDRKQIDIHLSRIEVLAKCYTKGNLQQEILKHQDLVFAIRDLVFKGGSIYSEVHYKNKFPEYDDFYKEVEKLKKGILSKGILSKIKVA